MPAVIHPRFHPDNVFSYQHAGEKQWQKVSSLRGQQWLRERQPGQKNLMTLQVVGVSRKPTLSSQKKSYWLQKLQQENSHDSTLTNRQGPARKTEEALIFWGLLL